MSTPLQAIESQGDITLYIDQNNYAYARNVIDNSHIQIGEPDGDPFDFTANSYRELMAAESLNNENQFVVKIPPINQ